MEGKSTCWRRVFVQTDTGSVLGMELDRSDNAHTVKKRLQLALNIPVDESSLSFGDTILKNDLSGSVRVGETGFREVAAYLLDYDHFANVPPTALVKITHSIFNVNDGVNGNKLKNKKLVSKIASFQKYMRHDFDASDHGTSSFPVSAVHRIGILDVRILNTDRHAGNLLVRKLDDVGRFGQVELIPIDHGLCLPESLEDPYFEWIHWPQASIPFSDDELDYIKNLDPVRDSEMLRSELPMIREACLRVLFLCTIFLKEAASFGLCLAEIGEMMSREFRSGEEEPSELEVICIEARRLIAEDALSPKGELDFFDDIQFDLDCEDGGLGSDELVGPGPPFHFGFGGIPLSKLDECVEEEEEESEGANLVRSQSVVSKVSVSLKTTSSLGDKNVKFLKFGGAKQDFGSPASGGNRSANEQLPASVSFVKVADMKEREWGLFLDKFQELLHPMFAKRKSITLGQRQRQRLGTSCQF
ncbi:phosphatidylinositol 4-kinase gamma 6 [Phtheirospermum japonicum]|uniref:1-phosphatidylinositol 4-kinase n=1 Tax=Phtheirospermum japonicum TaxID=374723 RepID=A0A830CJM6_9LAMI|nr:phosphatidylinositol 4-kinase gamma 6 [Phtheirospermum japonicum]